MCLDYDVGAMERSFWGTPYSMHVLCEMIKTFVYVTVTSPLLLVFVSTTNTMRRYKIRNLHPSNIIRAIKSRNKREMRDAVRTREDKKYLQKCIRKSERKIQLG
jgi:type IV secretory pathway VirB3-like protein